MKDKSVAHKLDVVGCSGNGGVGLKKSRMWGIDNTK